ncbi:MAG: cytochrome c5 family protein [Legionella sp.]|nr:MAG: cytochrome c5 family protein [Legionella sp.]PJD97728.1 MAG: cytochrome c5 family protein [Legionella sp.]
MRWVIQIVWGLFFGVMVTNANSLAATASIDNRSQAIESNPNATESTGQKIYERFCVVCHRDGLVGAPKFRELSQWEKRLSGREIDELVASALKGKNAMPAKGTCYECTEDDLKSAVEYMLPHHD